MQKRLERRARGLLGRDLMAKMRCLHCHRWAVDLGPGCSSPTLTFQEGTLALT